MLDTAQHLTVDRLALDVGDVPGERTAVVSRTGLCVIRSSSAR